MLVTPFTSRDGLCKSLVPSTTFRSLGLVAQNRRGEGGRGRKATKYPEVALPPNLHPIEFQGPLRRVLLGLLLGRWEGFKKVEKEGDTAAQLCPRDMRETPLPSGAKAGLILGGSEEPTENHLAQIKLALR